VGLVRPYPTLEELRKSLTVGGDFKNVDKIQLTAQFKRSIPALLYFKKWRNCR
jgi:hypothetical protein